MPIHRDSTRQFSRFRPPVIADPLIKMGNKASDLCLNCFVQPTPPSTPRPAQGPVYTPPTISEVLPPKSSFFPLKSEESTDIEEESVSPVVDFNVEDISKALDLAQAELVQLISQPSASDPSLELLVDSTGFQVYGKETARGLLLKTDWVIPHSPKDFIRFVRDFERRKQWDKNIEECKKVCYLTSDISINYQRFKKVMIVSARELLVACRAIPMEGSLLDVSCSVESPAFPRKEGIIRAQLYVGGYFVQPLGANSQVTAVSEMDFGGSIPKTLMKKMSAMGLPMFAKSMNAALDRAQESTGC